MHNSTNFEETRRQCLCLPLSVAKLVGRARLLSLFRNIPVYVVSPEESRSRMILSIVLTQLCEYQ